MQQVRQGDVFLQQVRMRAQKGTPVTDRGRVILAYGEVTGHAHEISAADVRPADLPAAQLFEEPDGRRFLFVERACVLQHPEHGTIALAPGCYKVIRQREYNPKAIRNVAD
jgi:hypothetical protein